MLSRVAIWPFIWVISMAEQSMRASSSFLLIVP